MRGLIEYSTLALQLLLISLTAHACFSQAKHHHKHRPSTFVVGTVSCDTHFVSGATVSVECNVEGAFKAIAKTNKRGEFKLPLPSSIAVHPETDLVKGCRVSLLRGEDPHCTAASATTSSSIRHLKSRVFSASFRPSVARSNAAGVESQKSLLDPIVNGPMLGLGPILEPVLPQLPPLLGMPNPVQPPSTPSFGFPGGAIGQFPGGGQGQFPGLTPTPPAFPIPFPPRVAHYARKVSP